MCIAPVLSHRKGEQNRKQKVGSPGKVKCLSLSSLQLFDIAGPLLERPLVAQDVSHKYLALIRMFSRDLDAVRLLYSQRIQEEAEHGRRLPGDYEGCVLLLERPECTYAPLVNL